MEEWKRDWAPLGGTQAYHEIFTGWLGKGARDRHTTLYRQHTGVAHMV